MSEHVRRFTKILDERPIIAILRGLQPHEAVAVGEALVTAGIGIIEVPLNSPDPFTSIARLVERFGKVAVIGAGTVRRVDEVEQLALIGAGLVLSPHCDPELIRSTVSASMVSVPGILTPTEAFAALDAGAHALKLFPMEVMGIAGARALKAVLPKGTRMIAVGGVSETNAQGFLDAGLHGIGVGSALYKPGDPAIDIENRARNFLRVIR
jgi:2-dehydro-3-deoxyphosphogalactonate aldolase